MIEKYISPGYHLNAFHCPNCHVYADQRWDMVFARPRHSLANAGEVPGLEICLCIHCHHISVWYEQKMLFPDNTGVQPANEDLPEDIKADYHEAASIVQKSPRGAAALLRLAMQKLFVLVGEKGKNNNQDIANLVAKGLSVRIQKALDYVRVIGNGAVHPGEINLQDNPDTAIKLFELINIIADELISRPKQVDALYDSLPEKNKDSIEQRDSPKG